MRYIIHRQLGLNPFSVPGTLPTYPGNQNLKICYKKVINKKNKITSSLHIPPQQVIATLQLCTYNFSLHHRHLLTFGDHNGVVLTPLPAEQESVTPLTPPLLPRGPSTGLSSPPHRDSAVPSLGLHWPLTGSISDTAQGQSWRPQCCRELHSGS